MLDISMSVFRLFGEPKMLVGQREGGGATLYLRDGADEFPSIGEIAIHMPNVSFDTLQTAIAAFNKEIQNGAV